MNVCLHYIAGIEISIRHPPNVGEFVCWRLVSELNQFTSNCDGFIPVRSDSINLNDLYLGWGITVRFTQPKS